jgi:hypothetical protein
MRARQSIARDRDDYRETEREVTAQIPHSVISGSKIRGGHCT